MNYWYPIISTVVIALIGGAFSTYCVGGDKARSATGYDFACFVTLLILGFVMNLMIFGWWPPVFHAGGWLVWAWPNLLLLVIVTAIFQMAENGSREDKGGISLATVIGVIAIIITFVPVAYNGLGMFNTIGEQRAKELAGLVHEIPAAEGQVNDYPPTDPTHIPIVHEGSAREKAGRVMGSLGSQYELADGDLQLVKDRLTYIFWLKPNGWRASDKANHKVPNYISVDAEDPSATAVPSAHYDIGCYPGGYFESNLERLVYGTRDYSRYYVDDLNTMEVDDQGNPFFTATLNRTDVRWEHAVPVKFITVDAVKCGNDGVQEYELKTADKPGNIPPWVDRVYSQDTVTAMMNWWGEWAHAPYQWSDTGKDYTNRYKVAGKPNLVYTRNGPAWQVLMQRSNADPKKDKAAQKLVLFDTRSNEIHVYEADGIQIESAMIDHFVNKQNNTSKLVPAQAAVYEIYNTWVWVGGLYPSDKLSDGEIPVDDTTSFNGVGILNATSGDSTSVILGTPGKAWALDELKKTVNQADIDADPASKTNKQELKGVITWVDKFDEGGTTRKVFKIEGDDRYFSKVITGADAGSMDALAAGEKDEILIVFDEEPGAKTVVAKSIAITKWATEPQPAAAGTPGG